MDFGKAQTLTKVITEWVEQTEGWFTYQQLDKDLDIGSPEGKTLRRGVLKGLCDAGSVQRDPKKNGVFRVLDNRAPIIDWQSADVSNVLDLKWPFKLEEWVNIYPKNIILLAGTFNAGKTAFCLNFIAQNMHRAEISDLLPIEYFSSEMGAEEMKVRLNKFNLSDWAFIPREKSSNFADVIKPNKINIIDYLEVTDKFYLIAEELTAIFDTLNKGICLITVQKKQGAIMGRGAEFSLEKPRLYLSLDNGQLSIIKGKNWAVEGQNPNGKKWTFQLVSGARFIKIKEAT